MFEIEYLLTPTFLLLSYFLFSSVLTKFIYSEHKAFCGSSIYLTMISGFWNLKIPEPLISKFCFQNSVSSILSQKC